MGQNDYTTTRVRSRPNTYPGGPELALTVRVPALTLSRGSPATLYKSPVPALTLSRGSPGGNTPLVIVTPHSQLVRLAYTLQACSSYVGHDSPIVVIISDLGVVSSCIRFKRL